MIAKLIATALTLALAACTVSPADAPHPTTPVPVTGTRG